MSRKKGVGNHTSQHHPFQTPAKKQQNIKRDMGGKKIKIKKEGNYSERSKKNTMLVKYVYLVEKFGVGEDEVQNS